MMFSVRALAAIFVVTVIYLRCASAATFRKLPAKKASHLGDIQGCELGEDEVLPIGETHIDGECAGYFCSGNDGIINGFSCGTVALGTGLPGCRLVSDLSLSYPDCCPKVKCGSEKAE